MHFDLYIILYYIIWGLTEHLSLPFLVLVKVPAFCNIKGPLIFLKLGAPKTGYCNLYIGPDLLGVNQSFNLQREHRDKIFVTDPVPYVFLEVPLSRAKYKIRCAN